MVGMEREKIYLSKIYYSWFACYVQNLAGLALQSMFPNFEDVLEIESASKARRAVTRR